jgi:xylitol oxidase
MAPEQNWSLNHTFTAARIHRPETIDEARRLVAAALKIHAVGSRHSFNAVADSSGEMIDLGAIDPYFVLDRDAMTVTLGANTQYGPLLAWLQSHGCALHNTASLPHITVIGAVATGTHGSGDALGTLSTAVAGLEWIAPDGSLVTLRRGQDGFDGAVVALGALGIVTRVTLDILPSFDLRQDAFADLPWQTVVDEFDAISAAAYSFSLITRWSGPTVDRLWLKTRVTAGEPGDVPARWGTPAGTPLVPGGTEDINAFTTPFGGIPGPWSERLPHFRPDGPPGAMAQVQSEYMLPRPQTVTALTALREIADRIDPHLLATEIRTMAADSLWLSPAYGHDTVALHFTWARTPEIAVITQTVEELLLPLGGRPHWGKIIHTGASRLAPLYPRLADFRTLAAYHDPAGKFRNEFLDAHVFG